MSADTEARKKEALRHDTVSAVYWSIIVCVAAWFIHATWPWGFFVVPVVGLQVVLRRMLARDGIDL